MTTVLDLTILVLALLLAFGVPTLLVIWIRAAADWCWLLAIRKWLVAPVSFAVLLVVTGLLHFVFDMHFTSPLAMLVGLYVTPVAAISLANLIALRRVPANLRPKEAKWRDFIFVQRRREQSDAYSAPSAET